MALYQTQDSRLASFLILNGMVLEGTEIRYQNEEDRVLLRFNITDEEQFARLKREFFEGGMVPALQFANILKSTMHTIREARELAREAR
jgi:hypothetical protein